MIDYDEFLTGNRAEATYTMFKSFLPKVCDHCLFLTFNCIFTAFSLTVHCLSTAFPLTFHCIFTAFSLTFHCLQVAAIPASAIPITLLDLAGHIGPKDGKSLMHCPRPGWSTHSR